MEMSIVHIPNNGTQNIPYADIRRNCWFYQLFREYGMWSKRR